MLFVGVAGEARAEPGYEPPQDTFRAYLADRNEHAHVPPMYSVGAVVTIVGVLALGGGVLHYALDTAPAFNAASDAHDRYAQLGTVSGGRPAKAAYDSAWNEFESQRSDANAKLLVSALLVSGGVLATAIGIVIWKSNPIERSQESFPVAVSKRDPARSISLVGSPGNLSIQGAF